MHYKKLILCLASPEHVTDMSYVYTLKYKEFNKGHSMFAAG